MNSWISPVLFFCSCLLSPAAVAFAPSRVVSSAKHLDSPSFLRFNHPTVALQAAPAKNVWILSSEDEVTQAVHRIVHDAATRAVQDRGHVALAIPGGSVLKILSSMEADADWVSKTTLAYVNHKCVPNDDLSSAIHAKASGDCSIDKTSTPHVDHGPFSVVTISSFCFCRLAACFLNGGA